MNKNIFNSFTLNMKIQNLFYLCAIFLLSVANSFALGKAASMGNLQTVVPSGPFDTARNPALLAFQTSSNSTGLFYSYIMHFPKENSTEEKQYQSANGVWGTFEGGIGSDIKQDDPKIYGMSGHIANTTKSANYTLGFEITDNGNDQFLVTEYETSAERLGIDSTNGTIYYNKVNEEVKLTEINPAFISSLGITLSNTSSFGLQFIIGYSISNEEKKAYIENYAGAGSGIGDVPPLATRPRYEEKKKKEQQKITGELGLGYLYKTNDQQIGLSLKTGEFSWIEKKMTYHRDIIYPYEDPVNVSSSLKMNGKYTSGPGVIAGAYKKISTIFAFAFESGIGIKNSYIDRELEYDENTKTIVEQKYTSTVNNIYSLKAGIEMNPSDNLAFMLGFGYLTGLFESNQYKEKGTFSRKFDVEMDIKYGLSTFGIQYVLNKNITIDFITAVIAYRKDLTIELRSEDTSTNIESDVHVKQIDEGFYLHTGLGVTMSF